MNSLFQLLPSMRFSCGDSDETFFIQKVTPKGMELKSEKTDIEYLIPNDLTIVAMVEPIFEDQLP